MSKKKKKKSDIIFCGVAIITAINILLNRYLSDANAHSHLLYIFLINSVNYERNVFKSKFNVVSQFRPLKIKLN